MAPLVTKILGAIDGWPGGVELVLVDDGSSDKTWDQIRKSSEDSRITGIRHDANRGQSAALWTGFQCSRGEVLATLDGDSQNDPADFPAMLSWLKDYDMVCGVRTKRADTPLRRISSRIARWARRVALGVDFADTGCNLRVFRRCVLDSVPPFDGMHRFMPVLARAGGAQVLELPVRHHPRTSGVSKYGVWNRLGRGIRDLIMIGLFVRRQLPVLQPHVVESTRGAQNRAGLANDVRLPAVCGSQ